MAYGAILGQTPTASNVTYNNSQTSSIITGTNVQQAIDQLFTSVSNGKTQIASAITDKGVSTSASDTFAQMAANIGNIQSQPQYINYGLANSGDSSGIGTLYNNFNPGIDLSINKDGLYAISFIAWGRSNTALFVGSNGVSYSYIKPSLYNYLRTSDYVYSTFCIKVEFVNNNYNCYINNNLILSTPKNIYFSYQSSAPSSGSAVTAIVIK